MTIYGSIINLLPTPTPVVIPNSCAFTYTSMSHSKSYHRNFGFREKLELQPRFDGQPETRLRSGISINDLYGNYVPALRLCDWVDMQASLTRYC